MEVFGRSDDAILENVEAIYKSLGSKSFSDSLIVPIAADVSDTWIKIYSKKNDIPFMVKNLFVDFTELLQDINNVILDYKVTLLSSSMGVEAVVGNTEWDNSLNRDSMIYTVDILNYNGISVLEEIQVHIKTSVKLSEDLVVKVMAIGEVL